MTTESTTLPGYLVLFCSHSRKGRTLGRTYIVALWRTEFWHMRWTPIAEWEMLRNPSLLICLISFLQSLCECLNIFVKCRGWWEKFTVDLWVVRFLVWLIPLPSFRPIVLYYCNYPRYVHESWPFIIDSNSEYLCSCQCLSGSVVTGK